MRPVDLNENYISKITGIMKLRVGSHERSGGVGFSWLIKSVIIRVLEAIV